MKPLPQTGIGLVARYAQVVLFGAAILYFGSTLFIPMCYGLLIAIVLFPICKWLELRRWPRSLAITAGLLIIVVLFSLLIMLLLMQLREFGSDLPEIIRKVEPSLVELQQWLQANLGISVAAQQEWWQGIITALSGNTGTMLKSTLSSATTSLFMLFLVPVYAALFLYNRETFVRFLEQMAGPANRPELKQILHQTIHTYFDFIKGMVQVYLIVGILNSIGLLALGIEHAILFGMLTAVMTIIPYIGIFVSALVPVSVAWITKDSGWYAVGVIAVFGLVQYLEANVIFPKVVGSQLKVSTWATLVAIIAGGIVWGVSGMILFIPFVGILKIIADHMQGWTPVTTLLNRQQVE